MSRQITFRAWDGKEMWTGFHILPTDIIVPAAWRTKTSLTFMQFTGLLDKNGKEIYEGDILGYWGNATWEVLWIDKKASFRFGNSVTNFPMTECVKKEIIGNIYENPNLLN